MSAEEENLRKPTAMAQLKDQVARLRDENLRLRAQGTRAAEEADFLRRSGEEALQGMRRQLREAQEDSHMLKTVVYRLNVLLSRLQEKRGDVSALRQDFPVSEDADVAWLAQRKRLLPLLEAYDEVLAEKEELVEGYVKTLEEFKADLQEVLQENQHLHLQLKAASAKGAVSYEEWKNLHDSAVLVLEENENLEQQLQVQKEKYARLAKTSAEESAIWREQAEKLQLETQNRLQAASSYQVEYTAMKQHYEKLKSELHNSISLERHKEDIGECKRLFEELKRNYEGDKHRLSEQLQASDVERKKLVVQVTELLTEQLRFKSHIQSLGDSYRESQAKARSLQKRISEANRNQCEASGYVGEVVQLAEHVLQERVALEKLLQEERDNNRSIRHTRSQESLSLTRMQQKLKEQKHEASQKVQQVRGQLKEVQLLLRQNKAEHSREERRLRNALQEKDKLILALEAEKRQLSCDLETMWCSVSMENLKLSKELAPLTTS